MQSPKEGEEGKEVKETAGSEKEAPAKAKGMLGILSNKIKRDELKPGDHIYSWRHCYLYAHHGIYVGDEKVIHFTQDAEHETGNGTVLDRFIVSSILKSSDAPCPRCEDQSKPCGVIASCLECFLSGGELYRFEYGVSLAFFLGQARGGTCTRAPSDPVEDVIHRAEFLLQNGFGGYDIYKNNCEDFAIYCKTELVDTSVSVGRSGQATSFIAATKATVWSSLRFMSSFPARTAVISSPLSYTAISFPGVVAVSGAIYCVSRYRSDIGMRRNVSKIPVERLVSRCGLDNSNPSSENCSTNASKLTKEDYSFDGPPPSLKNTHLNPPTNFNVTPSNSHVPDHTSSLSSSPSPPNRPFVPISDSKLQNIPQSWKLSLIVKPFGKSLELKIFDLQIRNLWQLQGELHIQELGKDFFVTKFDNDADYSHVLSDGPWFIDDYYFLSVSTWQPNFNVNEVKQLVSAVWVRLPDLPIEYFDQEILGSIGNALGKLLKIDTVTESDKEEGRFARLCILLDLDIATPLSSEILIGTYNQRLLFEGPNFFCFSGSCIGHDPSQCKKFPPPAADNPSSNLEEGITIQIEKVALEQRENVSSLPPTAPANDPFSLNGQQETLSISERRVKLLSNKIKRDELKPGDHIYSYRRAYLYSHHGIYVGNDRVIHFMRSTENKVGLGNNVVSDGIILSSSPLGKQSPCPKCGNQSEASGVNASCLKCFLDGGELYRYEYGVTLVFFLAKVRGGTCTTAASDPVERVIHRAELLLRNGFGHYHVLRNNCEDFAIFCKTGYVKPEGQQALTSSSVGLSGQAISFIAAANAIASCLLITSYVEEGLSWNSMYNALRKGLGPGLYQPHGAKVTADTSSVMATVMRTCRSYCKERMLSDIGIRRDLIKDPVTEFLCANTSSSETCCSTNASKMTEED